MAAGGSVVPAQSITAALRDLYSNMDKGNAVPPIVLLQVMHMAFPRFAEKNEHGTFSQQVNLFYIVLQYLFKLNNIFLGCQRMLDRISKNVATEIAGQAKRWNYQRTV